MTTKPFKLGAIGALALAAMSASAVPVGVRLAMHGRASALEAASAAFPELPVDASAETVAEKLSVASDTALAENITDAETYADFREWATSVGASQVKSSATAWMSYALCAAGIVPAPQEGDLSIDDVIVDPDGNLEAVFSLDGASIGSAALESRLKTVFGVEGAASLNESDFSDKNIGLSLEPTGDGRVKATVVPPADIGNSFFMRLKVK